VTAVAAASAVVLVAVVVAVVLAARDGSDRGLADGDGADDAAGELTDCPQLTEADMTTGELADERSTTWSEGGRTASLTVTQLTWREVEAGPPEVFVELRVENAAEPDDPSAEAVEASTALVDGVLVDDIAQRELWCESTVGAESLEPGRAALFRFGVEVEVDPSSAEIVVELSDDGRLDAGRFRI
jgi:hypothetical protein